jgi:hypothetical protein
LPATLGKKYYVSNLHATKKNFFSGGGGGGEVGSKMEKHGEPLPN